MSYLPFSEPNATLTATNYVTYSKKINLTSGSYYPVFTTLDGLGSFCVTDVYMHYDASDWAGTESWRVSLGTNVTGGPASSYNNIVNETSSHSGITNNYEKLPTLATTTVNGQGTTIDTNETVYVRILQNSAAKTTLSGTIIVGGFYSRVQSL